MRNLLIYLIFLFAIAGCDGLLPKKQASVAPAWVLSPPNDDRVWFWGVGEGADLDSAKRAALKDIAARLRVSISGQLDSQVSVENNKVDRQARTRISEEVQKTEFSHQVVDKTAQSMDGFYVLTKVDRQAFIRDLKEKMSSLDGGIQQTTTGLDNKTPLERFMAFRRLQPSLEKGVGYAQLLIAADSAGDGGRRLRHYESLQQQARQAINGLVFQIQARSDDNDLAEAVTTWLNENGIRSDRSQGKGGNTLAISSSSRGDEIYGSKMIKLKATLNLLDDHGRALASRDYTVSGSSTYDYRGARQSAVQRLLEALRAAGPSTGLGFSE